MRKLTANDLDDKLGLLNNKFIHMLQQKINELLKPNYKKLALFALIFVIFLLSIFIIANIYSGVKTPIVIDIYGNIVLLPSYIITATENSLGIYLSIMPKFIGIVIVVLIPLLTIFWWYIISCFIVSVYDKITKREEKRKPLL